MSVEQSSNNRPCGDTMCRFSMKVVSRILWRVVFLASFLASMAYGQGRPPQSVDPTLNVSGAPNTAASPALDPSSGTTSTSAARSTSPSSATTATPIKPGASLADPPPEITLASPGSLPELPSASSHNKVSLIGGTVQ